MKAKIRYYIAAARWLWENRSWANTRQKWKAFDRAMRKYETPAQRADREYRQHIGQEVLNEGIMVLIAKNEDRLEELRGEETEEE